MAFPRWIKHPHFYHRAWRYRLRRDKHEIRFLRRQLHTGDCAVDIGAYMGAYTYWMQRSVGPTGRVFAFEPQPELAAYLQQVVADCRFNSVTVENLGLSSIDGELHLFVPGDGPSEAATFEKGLGTNSGKRYAVKVATLDGYFKDKTDLNIRLIKCDVEGHELEVFKGAAHMLETQRPAILVECEQRHNINRSINDVFAYFRELGYGAYFYLEGRLLGLDEFDVETHQKIPAQKKSYVNNFVLLHQGRGKATSPQLHPY